MSLPIVQIKTRNSSSVDIGAGTGGILNGLRTGELGYSYTENALFIGPKNDSDGSGASILINEAFKLTKSSWNTAQKVKTAILTLTFTGNAASGNSFTHNITLPLAAADTTGVVSAEAQTFAGRKTFNTGITSKDALYLSDGTNNNITLATNGTVTAKTFVGNLNYKLKANGKEFNNSAEVDLGTIGVGYGGTGKTSWTQYNIVYASNTNALGQLAAGTAGQVLSSGGTTAAPSWIDCLSTNTVNAVVRRDSSGNFAAGQITATKLIGPLNFSLTANGKTFNNSAAIDLGTIGVGYGGTGKTSWTANRIVYASSTSALSQLPAGTAGQVLSSNGSSSPSWVTLGSNAYNSTAYLPLAGGTMTGAITLKSSAYDYHTNSASYGLNCSNSDIVGVNGIYFADACEGMTEGIHFYRSATTWDSIAANAGTFYFASNHNSSQSTCVGNATIRAGSVHGAVWNDYAEYRTQKETVEPGYCVVSNDKGQVSKTTRKYQVCDGIVSDTFGFSIGETEECKTPLAVSGRVLAYCEGSKYDYHAGDTVCAGPNGKVIKMTREEIREWPDRIVGTVSEIPDYETWGSGSVKVNGRIWIKVK